MSTLNVDFAKHIGKIKPMHAVNNGPVCSRNINNIQEFRDAGIPYARTHDAAFYPSYGGEHIVDISAVFPNFDADVNDEASYDFTLTDEYLNNIMSVGTQVYFRLGQKIEHSSKKYGIYPPKDFLKWAQICEHIIMHFNYGWANGHRMGIEYFEVWNEPDNFGQCWMGTDEEFFEFFRVSVTYLKEKFPSLKIGGPAICYYHDYVEKFLDACAKEPKVPMDFLSWHMYGCDPYWTNENAVKYRNELDKRGFTNVETHCNEWNYIRKWTPAEEMKYNYKVMMRRLKGASYVAACMAVGQNSPLDMMMYYDARPCNFNGLFMTATLEPMAAYYSLYFFNKLYRQNIQTQALSDDRDIFAVSAKNDKEYIMLTYYNDDDAHTSKKNLSIKINGSNAAAAKIYTVNEGGVTVPQESTVKVINGEIKIDINLYEVILIEM